MAVTRREFLTSSTAALAASLLQRTAFASSQQGGPAAKRPAPNLLLIVSDDQALEDVGCYGNATIGTPNIDRLAAAGVRFTRAFTPTAICEPSRVCIHTGLYGTSSGAAGFLPVRPGIATLGGVLKGAGYRTALVGKTHLEPIEQFGFDRRVESKELKSGRDVAAIAKRSLEFVHECVAAKQFFFLNVNFDDPHHPWPLTEAELPKAIAAWQRRQSAGPDPRDRACGEVAGLHDPAQVRLPGQLPDLPEIRAELARYCDAITRLDRGVGLVLDLLEAEGIAGETFVLFLSDNGMDFPFCKTTLWDGGVHLPLLARWPGVAPRGAVCEELVSFVDVMPTFLELAGVAAPPRMEGRSFVAALRDPKAPLRDELLLTHSHQRQEGDYPSRGIRTRTFKYLRNFWAPGAEFETIGMNHDSWKACLAASKGDAALAERIDRFLHRPPVELYDLVADPLERKNRADDPKCAGTRADLHARLKAMMAAIADPMTNRM